MMMIIAQKILAIAKMAVLMMSIPLIGVMTVMPVLLNIVILVLDAFMRPFIAMMKMPVPLTGVISLRVVYLKI